MSRSRWSMVVMLAFAVLAPPSAASSQDSSNGRGVDCRAVGCTWFAMVVANYPIGSLTVGPTSWRGEAVTPGLKFSTIGDAEVPLIDCASCKTNPRGFLVPPGILMKMSLDDGVEPGMGHHHGNGLVSGRSVGEGDFDSDDDDGGRGRGGNGANGLGASGGTFGVSGPPFPGGVSSGAPGSVSAGALPAGPNAPVLDDVTTTPEPSTILLVATGVLALLPFGRRPGRRE